MYTVYWIHYREQTDPATEGYIGITALNPLKRLERHKFNAKNPHLMNRVRNEKTVLSILHHGLLKEEAQRIEKELRPEPNLGWNIAVGGDVPPSMAGRDLSNTKIALKGDARTEAQKERGRKHSEFMKGRIPWNKGKTGLGSDVNGGWKKGKPRS